MGDCDFVQPRWGNMHYQQQQNPSARPERVSRRNKTASKAGGPVATKLPVDASAYHYSPGFCCLVSTKRRPGTAPLTGRYWPRPNNSKQTSVRSLARGGDPTTNIDDEDDGGDEYDRPHDPDDHPSLLTQHAHYHNPLAAFCASELVMRESNFAFPAQNRACVCITSQLYDRRGA